MNAYMSLVNQKLYFSKLLLGQLLEESTQSVHFQQALCQSALYQLESGYRYYLREVAANYRVKSPESIVTVSELAEALSSIGKHPAEAQEMADLEDNSQSWLGRLLAAHHQLAVLPLPEAKVASSSPIAVMQVDESEEPKPLTADGLGDWMAAFSEMVERHRELMVEC